MEGKSTWLVERNARFTATANRNDGHLIAAGTLGKTVFVYDETLDQVLYSFRGGGSPALSPDGHYLIYETSNYNQLIFDLENGQGVAVLPLYKYYGEIFHPVFSSDGSLIAGVLEDQIVRDWNTQTGTIFNAFGGPHGGLHGTLPDVSFSADGRYLVGANAGTAWVWEVSPGGKTFEFKLFKSAGEGFWTRYPEQITATALSPDNRELAVGDRLL